MADSKATIATAKRHSNSVRPRCDCSPASFIATTSQPNQQNTMSTLIYDDECWYLTAERHSINTEQSELAPNRQVASRDSPTAVQPSLRPAAWGGECLVHRHGGYSQRFRQGEGHIFFTPLEVPNSGNTPQPQRIDDFFYQ